MNKLISISGSLLALFLSTHYSYSMKNALVRKQQFQDHSLAQQPLSRSQSHDSLFKSIEFTTNPGYDADYKAPGLDDGLLSKSPDAIDGSITGVIRDCERPASDEEALGATEDAYETITTPNGRQLPIIKAKKSKKSRKNSERRKKKKEKNDALATVQSKMSKKLAILQNLQAQPPQTYKGTLVLYEATKDLNEKITKTTDKKKANEQQQEEVKQKIEEKNQLIIGLQAIMQEHAKAIACHQQERQTSQRELRNLEQQATSYQNNLQDSLRVQSISKKLLEHYIANMENQIKQEDEIIIQETNKLSELDKKVPHNWLGQACPSEEQKAIIKNYTKIKDDAAAAKMQLQANLEIMKGKLARIGEPRSMRIYNTVTSYLSWQSSTSKPYNTTPNATSDSSDEESSSAVADEKNDEGPSGAVADTEGTEQKD